MHTRTPVVHISTIFVHPVRPHVFFSDFPQIYLPPSETHRRLDLCQGISEGTLEKIQREAGWCWLGYSSQNEGLPGASQKNERWNAMEYQTGEGCLILYGVSASFTFSFHLLTAIICAQCSSTAIICGQCSLPDLNQQKECQKECLKECQEIPERMSNRMSEEMPERMARYARQNVRKNVRTGARKEYMPERMFENMSGEMSERMSRDARQNVGKNVRRDAKKIVRRYARQNVRRMSEEMPERMSGRSQKMCQKECQKRCQKECQNARK